MPDIAQEGAIVFNLVLAGILTLVLGIVALVLLQRAILRNMRATGGTRHDPAADATRVRRAAVAPLVLAVENAALRKHDAPTVSRILRRSALAHALAGLAFAFVATLLLLTMSGIALLPLRTAVVTWAYAWPTVLALGLLVGPDRRVQLVIICGYLGGLLVLCAIAQFGGTPDLTLGPLVLPGFFQPMFLWLLYAAPSLFLLLFLNRTIRTIGPLVLVFVFVVLIGSHLGLMLLRIESVLDVAIKFAVTTGLGGHGVFWGMAGLGMLAGCWPAWRSVTFLRDRYAAKRSSELLLTIGSIWLLQALVLASSLFREQGVVGALAAAAPLLAWRLTLSTALRPLVAQAWSRPPRRLLLLRVFGFGRRSRRLLDLLGTRWRLLGSIDLIAAPDLAARTVEPSTFLEFMRGRLASLFIRTPEQLRERLAAIDHAPDPDARFRLNQLFCADDTWRQAVTRLMGEASLVAMDLRGFTPQRLGCVYELQTLLDTVPVEHLVFLFDRTTDRAGLDKVLTEHWQRLDPASPNVDAATATLRLLDVSHGDTHAVARLLALAEPVVRTRQ